MPVLIASSLLCEYYSHWQAHTHSLYIYLSIHLTRHCFITHKYLAVGATAIVPLSIASTLPLALYLKTDTVYLSSSCQIRGSPHSDSSNTLSEAQGVQDSIRIRQRGAVQFCAV